MTATRPHGLGGSPLAVFSLRPVQVAPPSEVTKRPLPLKAVGVSPPGRINVCILAKMAWDESYRLKRSDSLWGNDAVPYMGRAIDPFKICQVKMSGGG